MLENLAWQAVDTLIRSQLTLFHQLADAITWTQDDRRRALALDDRTWAAWTDFLFDGPLPAEPLLPQMLRRLGEAAFRMSMVAEGPTCDRGAAIPGSLEML